MQKDQWQHDSEAQIVGILMVENGGWKAGAKGTRAHGVQRQAPERERKAHLRAPRGDALQIQMRLSESQKMRLKVTRFDATAVGGAGAFIDVFAEFVTFIGYGMPPEQLELYDPLGGRGVVAGRLAHAPGLAIPAAISAPGLARPLPTIDQQAPGLARLLAPVEQEPDIDQVLFTPPGDALEQAQLEQLRRLELARLARLAPP